MPESFNFIERPFRNHDHFKQTKDVIGVYVMREGKHALHSIAVESEDSLVELVLPVSSSKLRLSGLCGKCRYLLSISLAPW